MSHRGGYGKPWRPPADGWSVPPLTYLGGLYQQQRPALNNLTAYQNTTQVTLQQGQVGPPVTRYAINEAGPDSCEQYPANGLPNIPWIGTGDNQLLPAQAVNTFAPQGTTSFGQNCRQRGGKWVQFVRQWHGTYGWTSHDPGSCADTVCSTEVPDYAGRIPGATGYVPTYQYTWYESYQPSPDQTKYLTCSVSLNWSDTEIDDDQTQYTVTTASAGGSRTVDALSGRITSSLSTSQTVTFGTPADPVTTMQSTGGAGFEIIGGVRQNFASGLATVLDAVAGSDLHCATPVIPGTEAAGMSGLATDFYDFVSTWNGNVQTLLAEYGSTSLPMMPAVTSPDGYDSGALAWSVVYDSTRTTNYTLRLQWTRTSTVFSFDFYYTVTDQLTTGTPPVTNSVPQSNIQFSGSFTLSNPNTSADVYADGKSLLSYWNLADDAQYPPRMDGVWQIAPLMSRDEAQGNVSPVGFNPYYVNDMRSPIADANGNAPFTTPANPPPPGWTYAPNNNDQNGNPPSNPGYGGPAQWIATYNQMQWFDPNAYGFQYPYGLGTNAAATAWVQYALTGAVLGAPNPAGYQNYFDFRAQVWRCCQNFTDEGTFNDFYLQGYGQWLYDVINETGAQLPHCATQWTNNVCAFNKPACAYLIQADGQPYDLDGTAGPETDMRAYRSDALWGQKYAEYLELWPSYNFFRPAGADRFALEESTACCVSGLTAQATGGTFTSTDNQGNPVTLTVPGGSVWGGWSVAGFYNISVSGSTVTLGAKVLNLPAAWTSPSGDTGTVFGMLRFPTAPAILGRDAVSAVTDNHDGTCTLLLTAAEPWLLTGDKIDLYSTAITHDSRGNRVSEAMTALASNLSATVIDSTHVKVTASYATIAGTQYIMSHGAPDWCWDDNGRKGDFVALTWTFDYRTPGEAGRLGGVRDCVELAAYNSDVNNGIDPAGDPAAQPPPAGTPAAGNGFQNFTQTAYSIPFKPCCAMAVFFTPNGESSANSVTIPFPSTFNFDDRYGARWQGEIEQAMTDLLYEAPHNPCGNFPPNGWAMDDGTCRTSAANPTGGTTIFYAHYPFVEARITVPGNGGNSGTESAPPPPTGIGYVSPVTSAGGIQPPGMIGFDPGSGNPVPGWTFWGYRMNIENTCGGGCAFNYVDMENLPCVSSYSPPVAAVVMDESTAVGETGSGIT